MCDLINKRGGTKKEMESVKIYVVDVHLKDEDGFNDSVCVVVKFRKNPLAKIAKAIEKIYNGRDYEIFSVEEQAYNAISILLESEE